MFNDRRQEHVGPAGPELRKGEPDRRQYDGARLREMLEAMVEAIIGLQKRRTDDYESISELAVLLGRVSVAIDLEEAPGTSTTLTDTELHTLRVVAGELAPGEADGRWRADMEELKRRGFIAIGGSNGTLGMRLTELGRAELK